MGTRRKMKSALYGFLGTYMSRYSDYDGYWIFGFLVPNLERRTIDLLGNWLDPTEPHPVNVATYLARTKFCEQVDKNGVSFDYIREAELEIQKSSGTRVETIYGHRREGYDLLFKVRATMDHGQDYQCERSIFVAPHDPSVEMRSAGAGP